MSPIHQCPHISPQSHHQQTPSFINLRGRRRRRLSSTSSREKETGKMGSWRLKVQGSSSSINKEKLAISMRKKKDLLMKWLSSRKIMDPVRDSELMPPPGTHRIIDPHEPTFCICNQVSYGDMIACDNDDCKGGEWFHYPCVGLTPETKFKTKWYCPTCSLQNLQISALYCERKATALESQNS